MLILIVEDEDALARIYCKTLQNNGYEVETVCTGRDALSFLHLQTPDLFLIDIGLPDMHGVQLLNEIRNTGLNTPAIAMSGGFDIMDRTKFDGFVGTLEKPLRLNELIAAVKAWEAEPSGEPGRT